MDLRRWMMTGGALCLLAAGRAVAQTDADDGGDKQETPARLIRFLAVGDLPPFRQEIRNGIAYELDPPEGSVPPRRLKVATGRSEVPELNLQLGAPTQSVKVAGAARELRIYEGAVPLTPENAMAEAPWVKVALPEQILPGLVLLWRAPGTGAKAGDWRQPAALWLREDAPQVAPRTVRVVNVSPQVAAVKWGNETVRLAPRAVWLRPHPGRADAPLSVAVTDPEGQWVTVYAGGVDCAADERVLAVIYRADGERPRRPAKAVVMKERTRPVSVPPAPPKP